ncbi:MAG: metal-dependent hydrolase [Crocinitomicaceae bacterium]|jgi:kynurenine formamidase|nr:metal-dependent hydrolase [Crocinitomicaceae bacterium]
MILYLNDREFINTAEGADISLPLVNNDQNPLAWYVEPPVFEPVRANGFTGAVAEGGSVNFRNIFFNPHGHGTHTECLGHITEEVHSVNKHLKRYFFRAKVVSAVPEKQAEDLVITRKSLGNSLDNCACEALVIRSMPNAGSKKHKNYSATNPPYLDLDLIPLLEHCNVEHLLIDLPSVDRENDNGALAFHHAFWKVPQDPQFHKTITELVFVPDSVPDGDYILNLQTAPFENDASPSRPLLFAIQHKK